MVCSIHREYCVDKFSEVPFLSRDSNPYLFTRHHLKPNLNAGRGEAGHTDGHSEHEEVEVVDDEGRPPHVLP